MAYLFFTLDDSLIVPFASIMILNHRFWMSLLGGN